MENKLDTLEASEDESGGRAYHPPHLITYGNIREVTQRNGGTVGMNDGGLGNDKTGF